MMFTLKLNHPDGTYSFGLTDESKKTILNYDPSSILTVYLDNSKKNKPTKTAKLQFRFKNTNIVVPKKRLSELHKAIADGTNFEVGQKWAIITGIGKPPASSEIGVVSQEGGL